MRKYNKWAMEPQTPEWLFLYFCSYDIQSTGYCEKIWEKTNQDHCHHHSQNLVNSHKTLIDSTHGAGFLKQYHGTDMGSKIINCILSAQIKQENRSSTLQILIKTWRSIILNYFQKWLRNFDTKNVRHTKLHICRMDLKRMYRTLCCV